MKKIVLLLSAALAGQTLYAGERPLKIVEGGQSVYAIYHAAKAPESVKEAAGELQTYIAKSTGARLPITTTYPASPVIALGTGPHLQSEGISTEGLKPEGYRIVTKGENVHIFGPDDAGRTAKGGLSRGTQNGVCTFLERVFGIRWLMPGEVGEYVPRASSVEMKPMSLTEAPDFANRRLVYIREKDPLVQRWLIRNKMGYSIELQHGHNWSCFTPGVFDAHPEVFTLNGGVRVRPVSGDTSWVCTTNPETIRFLGERQAGYFEKNPAAAMASLSPSDGHGQWCECKECAALDEKLPDGTTLHTRRIVTFYNKVAEYVGGKSPGKLLGGYVYLDYIDPPVDRGIRFHPNVYPVFAPLFYYGPMAYRPEARERFHTLLDGWAPIAEGRMSFYGLPRLLQGAGRFSIPVPPGRKVLKDIFPALKKAGFCGARLDGMDAWGYGAAYNWVVAKLMWQADADVDALCEEFYARCYGKGGPAMSRLDGLLEEQTEKYIVGDPTATYHMQPKAIQAIYVPVFYQLEDLFKEARTAAAGDENALKRLELFGMSMRGLCRVLEDYGWLANAEKSLFHMPEPDFMAWLGTQKDSLYISPGSLAAGGPQAAAQAAILRAPIDAKAFRDALPTAEPMSPFLLRFKNHLVLMSEKEGEVKLTFEVRQTAKGGEMSYKVYDTSGNIVTSGQGAGRKEVSFVGSQGGIYHVFLESSMLSVAVSGAAWAIDARYFDFARVGKPRLHLVKEMSPLYFYVPKDVEAFELGLYSQAPGETCEARLYGPDNRRVAEFSTVARGEDSKKIRCEGKAGGFWKLVVGPAKSGGLDDVWIQFGEEIPYVCADPANRLVVERLPAGKKLLSLERN